MLEYVLQNPLYLVVAITNLVVVIYVIWKLRKGNGRDDDDEDGGEPMDEPDLDLPPGISLPRQPREELTS
jgi:hypothetical protein